MPDISTISHQCGISLLWAQTEAGHLEKTLTSQVGSPAFDCGAWKSLLEVLLTHTDTVQSQKVMLQR